MSPPQKLWQFTVSGRPEMPAAIGSSRCSNEWSLQSCQPISSAGTAMTAARKRMPCLSAGSRGFGS